MSVLSKGELFPEEIAKELFNKVRGKSSLAKLVPSEPIPFNGKDVMTFSLDKKVSIVGENEAKPDGGASLESVKVKPIKVVYSARVSDEFMYANEEVGLQILSSFADGFAAKIAEGFDEMAFHGVNPATGVASEIIGTNNFDSKVTSSVVTFDAPKADENIDTAVDAIAGFNYVANGTIISPAMRGVIAALNSGLGVKKYPEFNFGATPATLGSMQLDSNPTLAGSNNKDKALVGDFSAFKWGFAKEIPLEVIEYGDPDNTGKDLKGQNQVCLRSEAYIGWGILDEKAFALVKEA